MDQLSPEDFISWLESFLKETNSDSLGSIHTQILKDKLATCFNKVTPKVDKAPAPTNQTYCMGADCASVKPSQVWENICGGAIDPSKYDIFGTTGLKPFPIHNNFNWSGGPVGTC